MKPLLFSLISAKAIIKLLKTAMSAVALSNLLLKAMELSFIEFAPIRIAKMLISIIQSLISLIRKLNLKKLAYSNFFQTPNPKHHALA